MAKISEHHDLIDRLTAGIAELTTSAEWLRYLEVQSKFHTYSFSNALLISTQRPDATRVAGFASWRKLRRHVRGGERAIWILAPLVRRGAERDERSIAGFKFVPVFDVAQTDGDELPSIGSRLTGDSPGDAYERLVALATSLGYRVRDHEFANGVNGDCCFETRRIRVERTNEPAQRVKTLAHEIAHAVMHEQADDRARAELEAESVAFIVCHGLGVDSSQYSFGYLLAWGGDGTTAIGAIRAAGTRIQHAASTILTALQPVGGRDVPEPGRSPHARVR